MMAIVEESGNTLRVTPHGRLNASGAQDLERTVALQARLPIKHVVIDMSAVDYISSAGIRSILLFYRILQTRGGSLLLRNLSDYCREIMRTTGFESLFTGGAVPPPAEPEQASTQGEEPSHARPGPVEKIESDIGAFRVLEKTRSDGILGVTGDIASVLGARVTENSVFTRPIGPGDCLAGVGGVGRDIHDFFPVMGRIMAAGDSIMWLPTDGKATPDYFLLNTKAERLELHLAWGLSFSGQFDEVMAFESDGEAGAAVSDLYAAMFELARLRDPEFRGAVALAMRANMGSVFAETLKKAPTRYFAPSDGAGIDAPSNRDKWLKTDVAARRMDAPALVCGAGIDLSTACHGYDPALVKAGFASCENTGATMALYNQVATYPGRAEFETSGELRAGMRELAFSAAPLDTARLLDSATIKTALMGVKYVTTFVSD